MPPDAQAIARTLAENVAVNEQNSRKTWRKVTSLLDDFGQPRLTPEVAESVQEWLRAAGVAVLPPLTEVRRSATVRLRTISQEPSRRPADHQLTAPSAVRTVFDSGDVLWVDLDPNAVDPQVKAEVAGVVAVLQTRCPGIDEEMIADLLLRDDRGKIAFHGDPPNGAVSLSFHGVTADEEGRSDRSRTGSLRFQLIEAALGPSWLVTCFHAGWVNDGVDTKDFSEPVMLHVRDVVANEVAGQDEVGASTLLLAIAGEMIRSHQDAEMELESWLEQWELDAFRKLDSTEAIERETISHLLAMLNEFRGRLAQFDRVLSAGRTWLRQAGKEGRSYESVTSALRESRDRVQFILNRLRADIDLLTMNGMAHQVKEAEAARQAEEDLRKQLDKVAALLLVPGVIFGFFGANTAIPGDGAWWGLGLMIVLAVVSALVVYRILYLHRRNWEARPSA